MVGFFPLRIASILETKNVGASIARPPNTDVISFFLQFTNIQKRATNGRPYNKPPGNDELRYRAVFSDKIVRSHMPSTNRRSFAAGGR